MFLTVIGALNTGFVSSLKLFAVTLLGALPLGLLISFGSMNRWTPLRFLLRTDAGATGRTASMASGRLTSGVSGWRVYLARICPISLICRLVIWVIRGTPLMLQLIILFYIPGYLFKNGSPWPGGESGRFLASAIAFIINYACYFSEIYRGGIQGVPVGQQEAGLVLGMTRSQIFFRVTLVQMIKRIIPPMSNEIITLVKDTSLARIISYQELIWAGYAFLKGSHGYSGLIWPLFFTGIYFLLFNGVLTLFFGWLEHKLDYFR